MSERFGAAPECVLFDLDGTLLDTALDMGAAINRLLVEHGRLPLAATDIRPLVSHGTSGLIGLGFGVTPKAAGFGPLRDRFLELYANDLARHTVPFPGIEAVLTSLEQNRVPWGIVTNKPGWLTDPLLERLRLSERCACVVSGDTLPLRKPDPAPLLYASELIGISPTMTCYVGDARRDIEAGRRAGMATVVARYGYLGVAEQPNSWGADHLIDTPVELLQWFDGD